MQLTIETLDEEITLIRLVGRLDMDGVQAVDQKFSFAATTQKARIIVDLSGLTFLSSIGLRTLVNGARGQKARGGRLVLLQPSPLVRQVIETAGVDTILAIYESTSAAVAAVQDA